MDNPPPISFPTSRPVPAGQPSDGQPNEPETPTSEAPDDVEPATEEASSSDTPGNDTPESPDPVPARYSIGEVGDRLGLESHVLRYWETEFEQLDPTKDGAGRRVYTEDDIDIVQRIHHLLKEEMYTIAGARAVLKREGVHGRRAFREELHDLRDFLADLRDDL
jgi:DNA-binding transcriptional MerR regulator